MTPQLPSFNLVGLTHVVGLTLRRVGAVGSVLVVSFEGDTFLLLTPEKKEGGVTGWRATTATGSIPPDTLQAIQPILPPAAQAIYNRTVRSERVDPESQSLVLSFDGEYQLVIFLNGQGVVVTQRGEIVRENVVVM